MKFCAQEHKRPYFRTSRRNNWKPRIFPSLLIKPPSYTEISLAALFPCFFFNFLFYELPSRFSNISQRTRRDHLWDRYPRQAEQIPGFPWNQIASVPPTTSALPADTRRDLGRYPNTTQPLPARCISSGASRGTNSSRASFVAMRPACTLSIGKHPRTINRGICEAETQAGNSSYFVDEAIFSFKWLSAMLYKPESDEGLFPRNGNRNGTRGHTVFFPLSCSLERKGSSFKPV